MTILKLCSPSLLVEKQLEGADELKVGSGRDVVVSVKFAQVAVRQLHGRRVELFAHLDAAVAHWTLYLNVGEEL